MIRLSIVTPCSRPDNLNLLANSINRSRKDLPFVIDWYIVFDQGCVNYCSAEVPYMPEGVSVYFSYLIEPHSKAGNAQRNYALDLIDQGFVCFLDDDNLLHHNFFEMIYNIYAEHGYDRAIICNQLDENFKKRSLNINCCQPGKIDAAQYVIPFALIQSKRWDLPWYEADGLFIQNIARQHGSRIIFVNEINSYYNAITSKTVLRLSGAHMIVKGDIVTVDTDYLKHLQSLLPSRELRRALGGLGNSFNNLWCLAGLRA